MNIPKRVTPECILIVFISLGYMFGMINTYHRFPSTADIYPNLVAIMISSIGLVYFYMVRNIQYWSLSVVAWLSIFFLIVFQPFINSITYPDGMIFDLSVLIFCIATSLSIANIKIQDRQKLFSVLVYSLVVTAVLIVFTQVAQYLKLDLPRSIIFPNFSETRISGNVSQPNQVAFTLSLGVAGLLYLSSISRRLMISVLWTLPIILLGLGLGLTASRSGVILMIVVMLGYSLLFPIARRNKLIIGSVSIGLIVIGYISGSQMLATYNSTAISSIERISDGTLSLRWYQFQQAAIMFNDNMLTGVGWGNLLGASVDYAQELPWFSATAHTHFFISQFAVETGIIGLITLIPFVYILLKNFSFKLSNYQAAVYTMLAIFIAYSCSEFPLWLPRYLIIFVVLLSLIEQHNYDLLPSIKQLVKNSSLTLCILLTSGSIYYQFQYRSYSKIHYALTENSFSQEEKVARLSAHSPIFGFEQFDDLFLFYLMSEDQRGLEYKTDLADKVLTKSVSYYIIAKSANIHLLADEREKALTLYKAACTLNNGQECPSLAEQMSKNASTGSNDLKWVNMKFQAWRQANSKKTGSTVTSKPK